MSTRNKTVMEFDDRFMTQAKFSDEVEKIVLGSNGMTNYIDAVISVCDQYEIEIDRINCFNSKLINLIYSNINLGDILVSKKLNDTVFLSLLVDEQGKLSLLNIENKKSITNEIPNIDLIIKNSLNNIPSLYPATKTNFGIPVSTKFQLPLILKSN